MDRKTGTIDVLVVAGGKGLRMGSGVKKQYLLIGGYPVLYWTLVLFEKISFVDNIVLVVPEEDVDFLTVRVKEEWCFAKVLVVAGGPERHLSVYAGLLQLDERCEIVLVHDGVRPFAKPDVILELIRIAQKEGAAVAGVTPVDTIKRIDGQRIHSTLDRNALVAVQTPQVFQRKLLVQAFDNALAHNRFSTDDSFLVEQLGQRVQWVKSDYENIKITRPEDLILAESILQKRREEGIL